MEAPPGRAQRGAAAKPSSGGSVCTGVTVVIPCYNYAHFVGEAIASALGQTYPCTEVIVVDDGSTDDLEAAVEPFRGRIRCLRQDNAGLSAARNTGLREAGHPWVVFLDADDVLEPGMVERLAEELGQAGGEYGLVACADSKIDASGRPVADRPRLRPERDISVRDFLLKNQFMPSAVLARRDLLLDLGGFDTGLRSSEDRDMWIRLAGVARVRLIDAPLVRIRKHGSNMSKNAERMRRNMWRVIGKAYRARAVPRADLFFWSKVLGVFCYQVGWINHDQGRTARALGFALAAILVHPCPLDHRQLREPPLFRFRGLGRFLLAAFPAQR